MNMCTGLLMEESIIIYFVSDYIEQKFFGFGMDFSRDCKCEDFSACHNVTGKCSESCKAGWTGFNCQMNTISVSPYKFSLKKDRHILFFLDHSIDNSFMSVCAAF